MMQVLPSKTSSPRSFAQTKWQVFVHLVLRHESVCLFIVFPCQHCCILCVWHLYGIKWVMEWAICVWNILWAGCNLGTPKLLGTLVGNFMWALESWDWDTMHVRFGLQSLLEAVCEKLQVFVCSFVYVCVFYVFMFWFFVGEVNYEIRLKKVQMTCS